MATSVPVPMLRPRSAWASAGASLTPSPTIATTRPSACRRRITSALPDGHDLGDDLVDADLGGDRAGGRLVVAGQQHRAQPERLQRGDGLGGAVLDGVGDDEDRGHLAVPAGGDRGLPARLGGAAGGVELRAQVQRPLGQQRGPSHDQRVAVDDALDAEALRGC